MGNKCFNCECKVPDCDGKCEENAQRESSHSPICSTADQQLVEIYETQAIEAAMFFDGKTQPRANTANTASQSKHG